MIATYGMTETGSGIAYDGVPLDGVEVRIAADGEVQLRAPMLLRAYRDGTDPRTADGWFPTGDLGALVAGVLAVHGRRGDLIITGGENVWPAAVEPVLGRHPAVAEVAVVGRPDPEWGQRVVAVVVPADPSAPPTLDGLRDWVKLDLPAYAAPTALELVAALPARPAARCGAGTSRPDPAGRPEGAARYAPAHDRPDRARPGRSPRVNRLGGETSPYLRQHADNPVDWQPWGEDAFAEAHRRDVPVLVSIGYSACHWCHVMAHESFEDPAVAAVMNRIFVNVKVDREERPDVDDIYMEATQAMTGQGGWPMTVVCTPDGKPFFAGTYFPKERRGGMIGFVELCERIDELWQTRRGELDQQADQLTEALGRSALVRPADGLPTIAEIDAAVASLVAASDPRVGRLRGRSQVPAADGPEALAAAASRGDAAARAALVTTLDAMAAGGIYDHLGGGFSRYSVDGEWLVPHFEKMLYDNALLVRLYPTAGSSRASRATARCWPRPSATCSATSASPAAASRRRRTPTAKARRASSTSGPTAQVARRARRGRPTSAGTGTAFRPGGNFEHGTTIPNRMHARGELARPPEVEAARQRALRRPGHAGPARARRQGADRVERLRRRRAGRGRGRGRRAPTGSPPPSTTAEFLLAHLRRADGRWLRSWQAEAGARHLAYATDHGALVDAFTRLAEATGEARWVDEARAAADALLDLFWDDEHGGVFTTGDDAEALIARPKDLIDNATPCGQRPRRRRPAPAGRPDRRRGATPSAARRSSPARRDGRSTRPPSATSWPPSTWPRGAPPRSRWPATVPTCSPSSAPACCPTPCWPGASPTTPRSGRPATTASPTCASTTPASSRLSPPPYSEHS